MFGNNINHKKTVIKNKTSYTTMDALKIFLWAVILPIFMSVLLTETLYAFAPLFSMTKEVFKSQQVVKTIVMFVNQLLFFVVFYFYNKKHKVAIVKAVKLKREFSFKMFAIVVAMSVCSIFLFAPFINLLDYLYSLMGYAPTNGASLDLTSVGSLIFTLIAVAVFPAIFEELIFRGQILNGLREKFSVKGAILLSAIMFMLMHGSLQQTVYQFLLGIMIGSVLVVSGNLLYSIIFHFFNNAIVIVVNYISVNFQAEQASEVLKYTNFFDYATPVVLALLGVVVFVLLLWALSRKRFNEFKKFLFAKKDNEVDLNANENNIISINTTEINGKIVSEIVMEDNSKPKHGFKSFTESELFVLLMGGAIAVALWLTTTISGIV